MLILGDVAFPYHELNVDISPCDTILLNCEGYVVDSLGLVANDLPGVFNNVDALSCYPCDQLIIGLANNHVMDSSVGASESIRFAKERGYMTVGAGASLAEALEPLTLTEKEAEVAIIAAGWDVIGCKPATKDRQGVAPLSDSLIIPKISEQKAKGRKVLVYLHWGYELEIYPHPAHRESAKLYIDTGADIVIGCHSHCLQGFEVYKGKPIFYGLGNAIFQEGYYWNGRLSFPDFCKVGLAVEWDPVANRVEVASVQLTDGLVEFSEFSNPQANVQLMSLSGFSGMSSLQYIEFFRDSRRKKKFLPIFKERDSSFLYRAKVAYVRFRGYLISVLFKLGLKGRSR